MFAVVKKFVAECKTAEIVVGMLVVVVVDVVVGIVVVVVGMPVAVVDKVVNDKVVVVGTLEVDETVVVVDKEVTGNIEVMEVAVGKVVAADTQVAVSGRILDLGRNVVVDTSGWGWGWGFQASVVEGCSRGPACGDCSNSCCTSTALKYVLLKFYFFISYQIL